MSDTDTFERDLTEALATEYDVDDDVAADAAAKVAAFREDWQSDLTTEGFLKEVDAAPYDEFDHRFDRALGTLAADNEDCTDSRAYRRSGYDALGANPDVGSKPA